MQLAGWTTLLLPLLVVGDRISSNPKSFKRSQPELPKEPTGVKTINTANNVTIRYKEPGKEGVCETTPGVKSYSGYVDTAPDSHTFFWFFEARHDPENAPITLWLNGGPGSDSLIGLFEELGPCQIDKELKSKLNPHSWNELSNVLFLSQPVGVGFSYADKGPARNNPLDTIGPMANTSKSDNGRWPLGDAFNGIDSTELATKATWEILQGFLSALPDLDPKVKSRSFNLWTESYGGHYGPAFFDYFYQQNQLIRNGTTKGVELEFNTLGIINGLIDSKIQQEYFYEFAVNNTYGIKTVPESVYTYMKTSHEMPSGCSDLIDSCRHFFKLHGNIPAVQSKCGEASAFCQYAVQSPYYTYSGRASYDIRAPSATETESYLTYLNQAPVMNAIGVDVNYVNSNNAVLQAFRRNGDIVLPGFLEDIERVLSYNVRVALVYGDADYTCNWFGGEAVSLALKHKHSKRFRAAGYQPFIVNGTEYGETREYGKLSFTRVYEAGHEVPKYQPVASLQLFNRTLNGWEIPTGNKKLGPNSGSTGPSSATHTQSSVALPSSTSKPSGTGVARRSLLKV